MSPSQGVSGQPARAAGAGSMKERARAALLAHLGTGGVSADTLKYALLRHEQPETEALWNAGGDRDAYWAALKAWEDANPASDGNMRRVLEALTAEGLLTKHLKIKGRYKWAAYTLASAQEGHDHD